MKSLLRIANAGGYWGDDPYALRRQATGDLPVDYITMDFLAEVTMSILQKQFARDPSMGYARDFVTQVAPLLVTLKKRGIKVITNAGGVNPKSCAQALLEEGLERGLSLKIAVVDGDDVLSQIEDLSLDNMETGESLGKYRGKVLAANAYFGSLPIVEALKKEPDIVLCGRVTDTGITLAALIHEFGWSSKDYDRLAQGIVASHLLECGAQATGGNFTDFSKVDNYVDVGFPIVEFDPSGTFVITKQPRTGGLVSLQTVREQLLYEMGNPQVYITPDVIADFTTMTLEAEGHDRVRVSGTRGFAPTDTLKVSVAIDAGYKCSGSLIISGPDARIKAEIFAKTFWTRLHSELERSSLTSLEGKTTEFIGDDATHRQLTPKHSPTEIMLRFAARDEDQSKLEMFRKLIPGLILSGPSGVAVTGGAPMISRVVRYWPSLVEQEHALPVVTMYSGCDQVGEVSKLCWPTTQGSAEPAFELKDPFPPALLAGIGGDMIEAPLMVLAHARSGDKGDTANIGLIGRSPEVYVWLRENLTTCHIKEWFKDLVRGGLKRYLAPNLWAINFLLEEALGGGGTISLYTDAQGKTYGQALLRCRVKVPKQLLETIAQEDKATSEELT